MPLYSDWCADHNVTADGPGAEAEASVQLERHRSFRSEGPTRKGRNRKDPSGTLFFWIERSGPPDGGPDRVDPSRFSTRPAKLRAKSLYSGLKPENFLFLQPLRIRISLRIISTPPKSSSAHLAHFYFESKQWITTMILRAHLRMQST